jgi:hypothetical protein
MHLCANIVLFGLLPRNRLVRRNFFFLPSEKSAINRTYRQTVDRLLARRHALVDFLFALPPLTEARVDRIRSLATTAVVELETHPIDPEEYNLLADTASFRRCFHGVQVMSFKNVFPTARPA